MNDKQAMRAPSFAIVLAAAGLGCTHAKEGPCGSDADADGDDDGVCYAVDVTTPGVVDEIDIVMDSEVGVTYPNPLGTGPLTPELLESGAPGPAEFMLQVPFEFDTQLSPPARGGLMTLPNDPFVMVHEYGAIAKLAGQVVAIGWTNEIMDLPAQSYSVLEVLHGSIAATSAPTDVEVWGSGAGGPCMRAVAPDGTTFYLVRGDDVDCDGIPNNQDFCPFTYCDPTGSPALQAGCSCD